LIMTASSSKSSSLHSQSGRDLAPAYPSPSYLTCPNVARTKDSCDSVHNVPYAHQKGNSNSNVGILYCPGFQSSLWGSKSRAIWDWCTARGLECTCIAFDSHQNDNEDVPTIGRWKQDTINILKEITQSPRQIMVGSSMGVWLLILAALAEPNRIAGLLGIAAAPDFTTDLSKQITQNTTLTAQINNHGFCDVSTVYHESGYYRIHNEFLQEATKHFILSPRSLKAEAMPSLTFLKNVPVLFIHGKHDLDISYERSLALIDRIHSNKSYDATILVSDGDHRLSRPQDLELICHSLDHICNQLLL
jgi:pimeloyl-ACP methyl ester carboxylesterase